MEVEVPNIEVTVSFSHKKIEKKNDLSAIIIRFQKTIFVISAPKHILWVLIGIASAIPVSNHKVCFGAENTKN